MSSFVSRTFRKMMSSLAGLQFNGSRDLYTVFGYPREVTAELYMALYQRQDIAGRVIDAYPDATWREPPVVRKREKKKSEAGKAADNEPGPFEKAVNELAEQIDLWGTLQRLDRLTSIGHYGVLLIGLDGGEPLNQPVRGRNYHLLYLTPHGEPSAQITRWVSDATNKRYAQPETYNLTSGVSWTGAGAGQKLLNVNYTRTLHVAERALQDKSIGTPRLERIVNRLFDLEKLLGGSAEIYWQNAAAMRAWIADADVQWDPAEKQAMQDEIEEMQNGLRRDVRVRGVKPELLAADAQQTGAAENIDKELDFIAGATGIPKRILIGSERGELSSEQDENNWHGRVQERRVQYITPQMVRPLILRFIELGILPDPGGEFDVVWSESDTLGEVKRSEIAAKKCAAVASYVNAPGADAVVAPEEVRRWLGEDVVSEFTLADMPDPDDEDKNPDGTSNNLDDDDEANAQFNARRFLIDNAAPRTLYVRRDVLNWEDIAAWAKAQGFKTTVGSAMHVTIAFSRQPVDWMKVSEAWNGPADGAGTLMISAGGPRLVEPLGPKGAIVLLFASADLSWRHRSILDCGAQWEYLDYQPHVTISYDTPPDLSKIEPYRGRIEFGPEIFEEVDDDYSKNLVENRGNAYP